VPDRIARLTFNLREWTGWSREQPAPCGNTVEAHLGQVLGLADFGIPEEYVQAYAQIYSGRLRIMTLLADRLFFEYQHFTVQVRPGTTNLMGPYAGTVLLRPGQLVTLTTPTMDGGLNLAITLEAILDAKLTPSTDPDVELRAGG